MRLVSDILRDPFGNVPAIAHTASIDMEGPVLGADVIAYLLQQARDADAINRLVHLTCQYFRGRGGANPGKGDLGEAARLESALAKWNQRIAAGQPPQFLARKPVFMALGEVFAWWYEFDLKYPSPVSDSSEMAHIHRLHDLFGTEARKQHKMPAYREWLGRGQRARAALGLPVKRQKDL